MAEKNIYTKLAMARVALQKKALKKSGVNKYAGFRYFELSDFLPAVNEIFSEIGLCSHFVIEGEAMVNISPTDEPYYVSIPERAYLTIVNCDNIAETVQFSSSVAEAPMKGALPIQQLGSIHTYMRRYLYLEALEISECDGVDAIDQKTQAGTVEETKTKKVPKITKDQVQRITELFAGDEERMASMMHVYQVQTLEQLNANQATNIIRRMERVKS